MTRSEKGKWVRALHAGKVGWFPAAYARRLQQHSYETTKKTTLRSSAARGRFVAAVLKGRQVIATGRTSGRYLQLYSARKTGWEARSQVRRTATAKYQTHNATPLHASSVGARKLATIPADYTVASRDGVRAKGRIQVEYGSRTGWVQASRISKVALSTKTGKLGWKQSASMNISRRCRSPRVLAWRIMPRPVAGTGSTVGGSRWTPPACLAGDWIRTIRRPSPSSSMSAHTFCNTVPTHMTSPPWIGARTLSTATGTAPSIWRTGWQWR